MAKEKENIIAVHCPSAEAFRAVYDKLHEMGYRKDGAALFNVWTHEQDFNRGLRYVQIYPNTNTVQLAGKVKRRDFHIKVIEYTNFLNNKNENIHSRTN